MKLLVVEDDEDSRILLMNVFALSGHEVTSATNGVEAMAAIEKSIPDLIISDILMPQMDGYTLCKKLKADKRFRDIPFVFYTATYTDPKDRQLAMDIGCAAFLVKPMEIDLLLEKVETIIMNTSDSRLFDDPESEKSSQDIELKYTNVLTRKLDKKVKDLDAEREKYKRLVEALRDKYFFYSHDVNGGFTYLSPSVTIILGYTIEEFSFHYSKYMTANPVNDKAKEYKNFGLQGKKQSAYELEVFHQNGSIRRLEVTEEPICDKNGHVVSIEGIAQDITQKRFLESRIRKVHKMEALGTLAGGIAHDFNNILVSILGNLDMVEIELEPGSPATPYIEQITKAGNRARSLISQILTYSRQTDQEIEEVKVQYIITEVLKLLRPAISKMIEFNISIQDQCRPIMADPTQIHQVIMNLCANSSHAIGEDNGEISILLSEIKIDSMNGSIDGDIKPGNYVRLDISDTGKGIMKSDIEKIFDPYFSTKKKGEGTGLGLAMVQGIVNSLNGYIRVESEPGKGTRFSLYFPRALESVTV